MKHHLFHTITPSYLAIFIALFCSGCTLSRMVNVAEKKENIIVQPNPIAASGQLVTFEIKAQVPEKLIKDKYRYKLNVYYEYDQQVREDVGSLNFEFGEFIYENGVPTITKQMSFPYAPKKEEGKLMVQGMAIDKKNGDVVYAEPKEVAIGLNTTPLLLVRNNAYDFIPDNYKEEAEKPATLIFYFEDDQAKLRTYIGSNLQVLDKYISDNVASQSITITAGQAPDEIGTGIAQTRAKVLENYYRQQLQINDYSNKKVSINIDIKPDNLVLLKEKVQVSALPKKEKQEVLTILNSNATNQEKVKALQQTKAFDYLQQYVYPVMRTAEVTFNYNRNRKADYELYLLAKKISEEKVPADVLTEEELQHAATLTPLLNEKRKFYEAAIKSTDKWPAYYNLGVVYTEMAQKEYRPKAKQALLARAIHNLTFAGFRNPTAKVYYSLASAYHQRNDFLEALQYYDYAIKLGGSQEELQQIFADKAALEIEVGQYDDAIESLRYAGDSYQTNMNLGLSYLLKENYEGAQEFYTSALEQKPNDALAYYSLAIIGARTQNEQMLEQNLRKAVRADKSYTLKAINSLEFKPYRSKAAYKDALIK
ncbi:tetratricopeptide repeat protein [Pontibacter cellulosilyticus]|uniref:Tetratricopeptide repeat protein n=1 Tax=Pontibacter cellulosilyticus TaxID=1720253 RepID=A0A923SMF0_9BACT|nr:tetratricopeptide repeat protein [Pontibacter cellulosilyticus]MBC5992125.1 tetratricopeptide repeat protein [Pontibacter cellulosilyticus]